jgi:hypothetical protein
MHARVVVAAAAVVVVVVVAAIPALAQPSDVVPCTDQQGNTIPCAFMPLVLGPPPPTPTLAPPPTPTLAPTPAPISGIINGDFEAGEGAGWTTAGGAFLVDEPGLARTGRWSVLFGGSDDSTETISQVVRVPADRPYLVYWYTATSDLNSCDISRAYVWVDPNFRSYTSVGDIVNSHRNFCRSRQNVDYRRAVVDLQDYAGRTVELEFEMDTGSIGESSFWQIDDVSFQPSPRLTRSKIPKPSMIPNRGDLQRHVEQGQLQEAR